MISLGPGPIQSAVALHFSRDAIRELDRLAVEEFGIPSIVLMENAAAGATRVALEMLAHPGPVLILAGPGNNGGDGLAIARHLSNAGLPVGVVLGAARERYSGDAATNLEIVARMGLPIDAAGADPAAAVGAAVDRLGPPALVIDALLGTGLDRPPREPISSMIAAANALGRESRVLAIDLPSGLDADTGEPLGGAGAAVRATATVTFVGPKRGFMNAAAAAYLGRVHVVGIGAPRVLEQRLGEEE